MSEVKNLIMDEGIGQKLKYMNLSRRTFLKGAMAVGGALALAGCNNEETIKTVTVTVTEKVPAATQPTVEPTAPQGVTYPSNMPIKSLSYILPDYVKCTGCKKCMVACSYEHYGVPDLYKSRIRVDMAYIDGGRADLPIICMKCGSYTAAVAPNEKNPQGTPEKYGNDIPCYNACPEKVGAISKDPVTGAMLIDYDKCTVCGLCIEACADKGTGILRFSKDEMEVLGMCDHCGGEPKCVLACPESCLKVHTTNARIPNQTYIAKPEELARRVIYTLFGAAVE